MASSKTEHVWERTNVTNLLRNRQSGNYYARVKVNGKQKWRSLGTKAFSVAKLKLGDVEKQVRAQGLAAKGEIEAGGGRETSVAHFVAGYLERTKNDSSLAKGTKERRETAIKALLKTWPDLPGRDVRRVTTADCRAWASKALREGTGFVAPNAKTKRSGMAASSFNKTIDALRSVLAIACEQGVVYQNAATEIAKAPLKQKRLALPTVGQFQAVAKAILSSGSKWSVDCADMVRLLAYSGVRLREGTALRWNHVDLAKNQLTVPGTKSQTSHRVVPLFPALAALLAEIKGRRGGSPPSAPILHVGGCRGALAAACEAAGVPRMNHHDLRHLFATRCIESGVDIPTVSRWLGHSDGGALAMKTYGHLRQEHSQAQAAKVDFNQTSIP